MSFRKTMLWVAAALMVVAGGFGVVWAQAVPGTATTTVPAGVTMVASYTQNNTATITVTKNTPNADDFKKYVVGGDGTRLKGNLGTVVVTCNYGDWDVTLSTANGGKLRLPRGTGGVLGAALRKGIEGGGTEEVEMGIELGIFKNGNARLLDTIPQEWVRQSNEAWGPIAFSQVIGQHAFSATNKTTDSTAVGPEINGREIETIKEKGFDIPNTTGNTITFLVNGGLGIVSGNFRGNTNGTYTDTLKFNLVTGW